MGVNGSRPAVRSAAGVERVDGRWARAAIAARRPAVITGVVPAWPAFARWDLGFLAAAMADVVLPIRDVPGGRPDCRLRPGAGYATIDMPASEYFRRLFEDRCESLYLSLISIRELLPGLAGDVATPAFIDEAGGGTPLLWIGGRGTFTVLHYDRQDTLHGVIRGRKKFRLFDRRSFSLMYAHSILSRCAHVSRVDVNAPDLARYPRFARAEAVDVELSPGDLLFLPREWWHAVWTLEPSAAVTFSWGPKNRFSRAALHEKLSGYPDQILRILEGRPHPLSRRAPR